MHVIYNESQGAENNEEKNMEEISGSLHEASFHLDFLHPP